MQEVLVLKGKEWVKGEGPAVAEATNEPPTTVLGSHRGLAARGDGASWTTVGLLEQFE